MCKNAIMNNWDDIRFFLAVARLGTISAAAKTLGVNHSTVSRRIQALEEKHGVQLFKRQRDGYVMSDAAHAIIEQAEAIELQSQQISRTLFGQDSRLEGLINLTMPHDIFEHCLVDDLYQFQQQHPAIELNMMVSQGLRNLSSLEADLAIRLTPAPPDYLVGRQVATLQHGIYAATALDFDQPLGLIVWSNDTVIPAWATEHYPTAKIALKVDDLSSMYAAVKAGFGLARMPCYMPDSLSDNMVKRLGIDLPASDWGLWVLNHIDLRKTARVQRCKKFLLRNLEKKQPLFEGKRSNYG